MARKPARMYRAIKQQAYTRKEYMGGVPTSRITQFDMGNPSGKFPTLLNLSAVERCQSRHTALEAAQVRATKSADTKKFKPNTTSMPPKTIMTMRYHLPPIKLVPFFAR